MYSVPSEYAGGGRHDTTSPPARVPRVAAGCVYGPVDKKQTLNTWEPTAERATSPHDSRFVLCVHIKCVSTGEIAREHRPRTRGGAQRAQHGEHKAQRARHAEHGTRPTAQKRPNFGGHVSAQANANKLGRFVSDDGSA